MNFLKARICLSLNKTTACYRNNVKFVYNPQAGFCMLVLFNWNVKKQGRNKGEKQC